MTPSLEPEDPRAARAGGAPALTYPEVGATRRPDALPRGYRHLLVRHHLGRGDLAAVGEALLTWRVHAAARVPLVSDGPRAAPGVAAEARLGLGRAHLPAPCRVVWVEDSPARVAFGYGTLPGHLFVGEEAFAVERTPDGELWFEVRAFSRPAWRPLRLVAPATGAAQRLFVRALARGARRVARTPTEA